MPQQTASQENIGKSKSETRPKVNYGMKNSMPKEKQKKGGPISLHPLKFEEVVRDVLTVKPPKKEKRQHSGKRRDRGSQR